MQDMQSLEKVKELLSGASLSFHSWSPAKTCGLEERERAARGVGCEPEALKAGKLLLDVKHPAWQELMRTRTAARAWWIYATMPYVFTGMRLFLRERREELWATVAEHRQNIQGAALGLDVRRDEILAGAKKMLKRAYDPTLYPESWANEFGLEVREHSIEPPSYLRHTNAEEYQRELQRTLADLSVSMDRFESQCFQHMGDAAARLSAGLSEGGRVMSANVESFQRLFSRVAQMKFEGTAIFKEALTEAKQIIEGVDLKDLRKDGGVREETRERLQALLARYQQLQKKVIEKSTAPVALSEVS